MDLSSDPDEATHQLAAARGGNPTAWFDDATEGPPWPLVRSEIAAFGAGWRATFRRR